MRAFWAVFSAVVASLAALALPVAAGAQSGVLATPWTEVHASRVRLIAGRAKDANGQYFAGLEIVMADGWKTYWRMPGDSGVPPTFDWAGSTNVAVTKVLYPAPMRMPEAGGIAIGYKRSVLLPIDVVPQDPSKPIALKLALEFGVCREICIPATGNFELFIPAAAVGAPVPEIAAAIERVPRAQQSRRKGDPELKGVAVSREGPLSKLVIEASFAGDPKAADVFIEAPEGLYVPVPKQATAGAAGILRFETELGPDLVQDLKGKPLTLTLVGETGATEVQWQFP